MGRFSSRGGLALLEQPSTRRHRTQLSESSQRAAVIWELLGVCFKPHPWHGLLLGAGAPELVTCFIEIVPTDTVKHEIDKQTGYLKVDRPQQFSNCCPTLYGFLPQTFCGEQVATHCQQATGRADLLGDGDPLDVCVLSKEPVTHGNVLMEAVPIGGLRLVDNGEVDDKIIAVLKGDVAYGHWRDIADCPAEYLQRIQHYFATYKQHPAADVAVCEVLGFYGRPEAHEIIRRSQADYHCRFSALPELLADAFIELPFAAALRNASGDYK